MPATGGAGDRFDCLHGRSIGLIRRDAGSCCFGGVYHTYSTTGRGVEFLMGYYPILDRAPKGRDEGEAWQVWIRPHDEYE